MKSLIIVGFLVAAFLQAEGRSAGSKQVLEDTIRESTECAQEMGAEKASTVPAVHGNGALPEDNPALNELMGCVWNKKGIINSRQELNEAKLEDYFVDLSGMFVQPGQSDIMHKIEVVVHDMVQECKSVRGNDFGQTAVKVQNCLNANIQKKLGNGAMGMITPSSTTYTFSLIFVMLFYFRNTFL